MNELSVTIGLKLGRLWPKLLYDLYWPIEAEIGIPMTRPKVLIQLNDSPITLYRRIMDVITYDQGERFSKNCSLVASQGIMTITHLKTLGLPYVDFVDLAERRPKLIDKRYEVEAKRPVLLIKEPLTYWQIVGQAVVLIPIEDRKDFLEEARKHVGDYALLEDILELWLDVVVDVKKPKQKRVDKHTLSMLERMRPLVTRSVTS